MHEANIKMKFCQMLNRCGLCNARRAVTPLASLFLCVEQEQRRILPHEDLASVNESF